MNQPPRKPRTKCDFHPEDDGLSSGQIAKELENVFNPDVKK